MSRAGEFEIASSAVAGQVNGFRRVIVGVEHPYIAGGLAMDATGIGTGHNDSFVYQARAFLDEVAGRDELPRNASFADGLHALLVEEAVVRTATQDAHPGHRLTRRPRHLERAMMLRTRKLATAAVAGLLLAVTACSSPGGAQNAPGAAGGDEGPGYVQASTPLDQHIHHATPLLVTGRGHPAWGTCRSRN